MAACSSYWAVTFLTTPWIACVPKCPVAGPVYTSVTFEYGIIDPPMIQTCRVDDPILSKGAGLPFAEVVAVDPASSVMAACSSYWAVTFLTTPWIACVPKCPVAGPVYTSVMFEYSISDPPMIQTCRVDDPILSKGDRKSSV